MKVVQYQVNEETGDLERRELTEEQFKNYQDAVWFRLAHRRKGE